MGRAVLSEEEENREEEEQGTEEEDEEKGFEVRCTCGVGAHGFNHVPFFRTSGRACSMNNSSRNGVSHCALPFAL